MEHLFMHYYYPDSKHWFAFQGDVFSRKPSLVFPGASPPQVIMERQEEPLFRHVPEEEVLLLLCRVLGHIDQGQLCRPKNVELISEPHEEVFEDWGEGLALGTGSGTEEQQHQTILQPTAQLCLCFYFILVAVVPDQDAAREERHHGGSM